MQAAAAHPDFPRGQGAVSVGFLERPDDELLFGFVDGHIVASQQARWIRAWRRGHDCAADCRGKVARGDFVATAKDHGVLDGRAQFANVTRPGIPLQELRGFRAVTGYRLLIFRREFTQEGLRQQREILAPLA